MKILHRLAIACTFIFAIAAARAQQVAITVDDLPNHGPLPPGMTRVEIADKVIAALKKGGVPEAYGMVIGSAVARTPGGEDVLKHWRAAGLMLGSHTWSHMNLNDHSVQEWEADTLKNEALLEPLMKDRDYKFLRFPFLAEGDNLEKRETIRTFLTDHGYKEAPVTISFQDYNLNAPYVRCMAKEDVKSLARIRELYLTAANEAIREAEGQAQAAYGRAVPQVLLVHIGAIEAEMLPQLIELFKQKKYTFIKLPDAVSDPAYNDDAKYTKGGLFFFNQAMAKHATMPQHYSLPSDEMKEMCK